jgi:cold shock protein
MMLVWTYFGRSSRHAAFCVAVPFLEVPAPMLWLFLLPGFWADGLLRQMQFAVPMFYNLFCWRAVMPQGTIKKLVVDRGFGFIKGDRDEMFFHHSEVKGVTMEELHEGQNVEYEVGQGKKGPCAVSVRVV